MCGQPVSSSASQAPIFFFACEDSNNKVCGQVRDINLGSPDVFLRYNFNININAIYVDGISSTNDSNPRKIYSDACHALDDRANICDLICKQGPLLSKHL